MTAAKLLFQYALGKPAEAVEPDRLDLDEWQQYKDQAPMLAEMPRVADKPDPDLLLRFMRELRPVMTQQVARQMSAKLDAPIGNGANGQPSPKPNGANGQRDVADNHRGVEDSAPATPPVQPSPIGANGQPRHHRPPSPIANPGLRVRAGDGVGVAVQCDGPELAGQVGDGNDVDGRNRLSNR